MILFVKLLRQFCLILVICFIGEFLHRILNIPIPGSVIGMVILLIALLSGIIKLEMLEEVSEFLLKHLAFFFVPASVGLISCLGLLKGKWVAVMSILLISTAVIIAITGLTVQFIKGDR